METWIDRLIRQAQERGEFDNLPGKGKPLNLDDDALTEADWRLARRLLKNAGFAPEWIERDSEIRQAWGAARAALVRTWQWRNALLAGLGDRGDLEALRERELAASEWARAVRQFTEAVAKINRLVDTFNLKAPALRLQRRKYDAAVEVARLERGQAE